MLKQRAQTLGVHAILIAYCALAIGPILLVVMNSFKARKAIFGTPLAPPTADTFSLIGYAKVFNASHVVTYFMNSLIVTLVSMGLVLLFGAMAGRSNGAITSRKMRVSGTPSQRAASRRSRGICWMNSLRMKIDNGKPCAI